MIWLLLLFTVSSAFGVLESLFELVGVLIVVLNNAVEDLAGKQAAAMTMVVVVGAGVAYGVWYFKASPDDRPPPQVDVARYTPLARAQPRAPARPPHGPQQCVALPHCLWQRRCTVGPRAR